MKQHYQDSYAILKKIKRNPLESIEIINWIESQLIKKRGHVFKIPEPKTRVIVLLSGGIDTAITAGILLSKYKLNIVPIFFDIVRDNRRDLFTSALKITNYYKDKYPGQVEDITQLTSTFPPPELTSYIFANCWKIIDKSTGRILGLPFELDTLAYSIIALIQNDPKYSKIRNLYFGIHAGDTRVHQHHTLTAFRSLMLHVCSTIGDFSYQITSVPIEKEIGLYLTKPQLIKIGAIKNFPFEITRTCRIRTKYPCGRCALCDVRRYEFKQAGITDKILYEDQRTDLIGILKRKIPKFAKLLKKY